jgi:hypothetical protein
MNYEQALELVIAEAETSALGDNNQKVLLAIEVVEAQYDEHGHHFANFTLDNSENSVIVD